MQFSKLRLSGFKSFVDTTELDIQPGMTGVVGPNGCGKSNLVEALKWVMGETSAKQMRGSEMEDVIFGGTASRPARNIAEVTLTLDNRDRKAPAQFNDLEHIEVVRRIERGMGSAYSINGADQRARDVQTMFADNATGARSTALVSQGRIGALINARPADRRLLIDEAAGITGLYARRHEAELRLRAAETNLTRVQDVINTLEEQLKMLKKQARQASRYRNLSDHIRRAEAMLLALKLDGAIKDLARCDAEMKQSEAIVTDLTRLVAGAAASQADAAAGLPALRQAEAEAAARLQRLRVAADSLEQEERRIEAARAQTRERLDQIAADRGRESERLEDADRAIADLDGERDGLKAAQSSEAHERQSADIALAEAREATHAAERALDDMTHRIAGQEAHQQAVVRELAALADLMQRQEMRRAEIADHRAAVEREIAALPALHEAELAASAAEQALHEARGAAELAETELAASDMAAQAAAARTQAAGAKVAHLRAEESALASLLSAGGGNELWPALIDAISVTAGYETALGAALGDDLQASSDAGAPVHWRLLPAMENAATLPEGVQALHRFVQGPAEISRSLAQIGVVENDDQGNHLHGLLQPGQMLVTREGALWRWDGMVVRAGTATAAATRLSQRNRLGEVRAELAILDAEFAELERQFADLRTALDARQQNERAMRLAVRAAEEALMARRNEHSGLRQQAAAATARLQGANDSDTRLQTELGETAERHNVALSQQAAFVDLTDLRDQAQMLRQALADRRGGLIARQANVDRLVHEAALRAQRLAQIASEREGWSQRAEQARRQIDELAQRRDAAERILVDLDAKPAEIARQRAALASAMSEAEGERQLAADRLAEAESRLAAADKALRALEADLQAARETRVRRQGLIEQAGLAHSAVIERIRERIRCEPEQILEAAGVDALESLPELDKVEQRVQRLVNERETMGAVNLRAEEEADEMEKQIGAMTAERDDLVNAIARLRQGIANLNREGRERFLAAFEQVDRHFQELFTKLFGGGRAQLRLTESEDPLEAGLEIMASPPGKRLQVMSLLSGGEQALTALALLFAVFMTNPAPICVLDEVDAPLDDANVERFCALVREIGGRADTRFLIITHHRVTMARMDRLFGVTMTERGVSQLVSVDLSEADRIAERAEAG